MWHQLSDGWRYRPFGYDWAELEHVTCQHREVGLVRDVALLQQTHECRLKLVEGK